MNDRIRFCIRPNSEVGEHGCASSEFGHKGRYCNLERPNIKSRIGSQLLTIVPPSQKKLTIGKHKDKSQSETKQPHKLQLPLAVFLSLDPLPFFILSLSHYPSPRRRRLVVGGGGGDVSGFLNPPLKKKISFF
ncbi:hypothetical protein L2E82_01651 [Cichorium intybus]|uniref:Uncharacterized protein n=1 Tax=Cichorium intybus TaxID=13427 RepID=A0ACB9H060_CICIN|nr:hypothetical protein L2E82_01651 [Cichorium intybus]